MNVLSILILTGIGAVVSVPASAAMSAANCTALWNRADTNDNGELVRAETLPYVAAMTDAEMKPVQPGLISKIEFMKACEDGAFRAITTTSLHIAYQKR